jgi:hypothetical protein
MTRIPLAGAWVYEWVALRRVSSGGVVKIGHRWLESGHQLPAHIAGALARLLTVGQVMLLDPDPNAGGSARAILTTIGHDRYEQLLHRALQLPAAQFITLCRRFVDDDPDPVRDTALPD